MNRTHRILLYCLIAYGVAWGYWLWMLATDRMVYPGSPDSHLPGLMGPMIAALAVTAITEGRAGLVDLGRRMVRLPQRPGWFLAAVLMPPVLAALVFVVKGLRGVALPPLADFFAYPGLPAWMGPWGLIAVLILNGYGEEVGWRGWLFDTLQPPHSRFVAALIVAAIWMAWHLPLFWLNATMAGLVGPVLPGWMFALAMGSFVLAQIYRFTGRSIGAVVLWHVVYNFCVATSATSGLVAVVVSTAVMVWGAVVAILWAWRGAQPRIATT